MTQQLPTGIGSGYTQGAGPAGNPPVDGLYDPSKNYGSSSSGGAAAGGGVTKVAGVEAQPLLAATPSPLIDPWLWMTVRIGTFTWPLAQDGSGKATVTCESGQKLDEQKASGKDKAKMKQGGREPVPVDIDLECKAEAWPMLEAMLNGIDPNGPSRGGPFEIGAPDANRRGVKNVMVKKVGAVVWKAGGALANCKVTAVEWELPKKAAAGVGTKTPTKPSEWYDSGKENKEPKVNEDGTITLYKSKGYGSQNGPNASP